MAYTPLAVSSALVSAHAIAKQLSVHAVEQAEMSRADSEKVVLQKHELLRKIEECKTAIKELILNTIDVVKQLYFHVNLSLQAEGHRIEATAMCATSPADDVLRMKLQQLTTESQRLQGIVQSYIEMLKLDEKELIVDSEFCTGKLLDACISKVQKLQRRWEDENLKAINLSLQIQMESIYGAAANCLIEICQFGLQQQVIIEPMPQSQEDVLIAMSTCIDLPYSGSWPTIGRRLHRSTTSNQINASQYGGQL